MPEVKKKIYVGCSLTQATAEFRKFIDDLKNLLRPHYEMLDFIGLVGGTETDVYRHDIECVKKCDLLLAEVTYPAIGLGFELATAIHVNKPILAVAKEGALVSRLVLGIDAPGYTFKRYTEPEEIVKFVEEKLSISAKFLP